MTSTWIQDNQLYFNCIHPFQEFAVKIIRFFQLWKILPFFQDDEMHFPLMISLVQFPPGVWWQWSRRWVASQQQGVCGAWTIWPRCYWLHCWCPVTWQQIRFFKLVKYQLHNVETQYQTKLLVFRMIYIHDSLLLLPRVKVWSLHFRFLGIMCIYIYIAICPDGWWVHGGAFFWHRF